MFEYKSQLCYDGKRNFVCLFVVCIVVTGERERESH